MYCPPNEMMLPCPYSSLDSEESWYEMHVEEQEHKKPERETYQTIHSNGPWNPMVNWMGYVAVSDDETTARLGRRDITIAWRGTVTKLEWMEDLMNFLKPVSAQNLTSQDPSIKVMAGLLADVVTQGLQRRLKSWNLRGYESLMFHDKVPNVPGILFHEYTPSMIQRIADWTTMFYSHIGEELALDHTRSSFVKKNLDIVSTHNLELLLHLIDGYHGKGGKFWLATGRDKALVNKNGDILKHECLIPPNWSQVENKGLRKNQKGEWMLPEEESIEDHLRPDEVYRHLQNLCLL
ncbi:hypothetical protein Tco_0266368 [Tanacetum coccineum]